MKFKTSTFEFYYKLEEFQQYFKYLITIDVRRNIRTNFNNKENFL
jgi:hypothetical protein